MAVKKKKQPVKKEPGWINKKDIAATFEISVVGFDKWEVEPVAKIGRETFYLASHVAANRTEKQTRALKSKIERLEGSGGDEESLDPQKEKTLLDREKRIGQELTNDKNRGDSFPTKLAGYVMSTICSEMVAVLESLPAKLKRVMPKMTATQMTLIKKEIAKCRNSAADVEEKLDDIIEQYNN